MRREMGLENRGDEHFLVVSEGKVGEKKNGLGIH